MTNTQVTLIQIDNYGPWTVTPEPRREVDLQTLQSRLYADLSQLVGNREGYVFFSRFDNMVAVTNGLDTDAHGLIQESVGNRYPVTVSLSTPPRRRRSAGRPTSSRTPAAPRTRGVPRYSVVTRSRGPSGATRTSRSPTST